MKLPTNEIDHAIAEMVNAFLRWPLPESVNADGCATRQGKGRTGTNLLSVGETCGMMQEVVRPVVDRLLSEQPSCRACTIFGEGPCAPKAIDKMQDKVARAIHAEHNHHEGQTTPWIGLHRFQRDKYRGKAYAALVAIGVDMTKRNAAARPARKGAK